MLLLWVYVMLNVLTQHSTESNKTRVIYAYLAKVIKSRYVERKWERDSSSMQVALFRESKKLSTFLVWLCWSTLHLWRVKGRKGWQQLQPYQNSLRNSNTDGALVVCFVTLINSSSVIERDKSALYALCTLSHLRCEGINNLQEKSACTCCCCQQDAIMYVFWKYFKYSHRASISWHCFSFIVLNCCAF